MQKSFFKGFLGGLSAFAFGVCFGLTPAWAQSKSANAPTSAASSAAPALPKNVVIGGKTVDGQAFDLAQQKGKVVLAFFWATDCAVCRDKMPELRENAKGWADKPFTAILINTDKRMSEIERYNAIINTYVPVKERLTQLWALDPSYKDSLATPEMIKNRTATTLPLTLVIDKQGNVVKRYQGRVPAEVWDDIAELL
jgi:thiol-disulfide isomerase/thioredoxin